jgi:hypothetical protein
MASSPAAQSSTASKAGIVKGRRPACFPMFVVPSEIEVVEVL